MIDSLPPGWILILGALLVPFLRGRVLSAYVLLLPVAGFLQLLELPQGESWQITIFTYTLTLMRVDKLSLVFGYVFYLAAFLGAIYALTVKDKLQQMAALIFAGSALGAVFAGDLITLFIYWEMTAVASVFLIWARRSVRAFNAGMRYLLVQIGSGVILLAGVVIYAQQTGSLGFNHLGTGTLATNLIFIAFGIKCAFPVLHNWLADTYPEATETGTVYLSAFTTKIAVYALARGFAGTEILIYIGAVMTAFPIFFAVIENDLRRVLAYSLINQIGFMVVGVGLGTTMALNGAVAHAFADILFKGLLFMTMGAVLLRTGTIKGSELGGLYKSMPLTATFCIVGAASISAFPLFSAFVTKSLILTATAENGYYLVWFVLIFASAGVFHHAGIKIPYFAFFAHDSGIRCKEAPTSMLIAMGLTAALCIGIGVMPDLFYRILPYQVDYVAYTTTHVITQLQLLFFSALAFAMLVRTGIYPPETKSINVDTDWLYRRALPRIVDTFKIAWLDHRAVLEHRATNIRRRFTTISNALINDDGLIGFRGTVGDLVLWIALMLLAYLMIDLF